MNTPQRTYQVYSSPNRADSNFDAPKPGVDSDGDGIEDRLEYSGSDLFAAPAGWEDKRLGHEQGRRDRRSRRYRQRPPRPVRGLPARDR